MVEMLIKHGADVNVVERLYGDSPIYYATTHGNF